MNKSGEIVASPGFPTYSIAIVRRYVIIGGGGGAAKTGIKNKFDVYELYHTGHQTTSECLLSYDVGDACVSNMVGWSPHIPPGSKSPVVPPFMLAMGQEQKCSIATLKPSLVSNKVKPNESTFSDHIGGDSESKIRKRKASSNITDTPNVEATKDTKEDKRKFNDPKTTNKESYFTYSVENIKSVETVMRKTTDDALDVYQKCVRVSLDHKLLATGGTDGHVRLWSLPDMTRVQDIPAHTKEVDDVDISPDAKQIISVSKPSRECTLWDVKDGKQVLQLALPTNGVKYKFYKARYGTVEGDKAKSCLFTISNPVFGSKPPAIVTKWCGKTYVQQKSQTIQETLSSLAISDDGRYVATGTMSGSVYIMIAFSLQTLRVINRAHDMFVTGLEWLPSSCPEAKMATGFSEASVLSISCDNTIKIHHIPRRGTVPLWAVVVFTILCLVSGFLLLSILDI